ncbi:hypothetical protein H6G36_29545 [Anabaena minutissima FACHB-250]|nr:hypothetical protein [Anabaena minutissima FACHB-250]
MADQFIEIKNQQFKVEPVSKIYFRGLTECLRDLGDVDLLSKSAKTIKKVIIPTIPDDIILRGDGEEEFYLWHPSVEPEEINDIILKCARCYRTLKLEEAKAKGDEQAIAEHTEGLVIIDKYLNPEGIITVESTAINSTETPEQLKARIKELETRYLSQAKDTVT